VPIKKLLIMIDGCLQYSFFSRDANGDIIGMDSNLGWHNENKGMMIINEYYKEGVDYENKLAKFGKQIMEMD